MYREGFCVIPAMAAFRDTATLDILVKIEVGRCLNTVAATAEIDDVEIGFEDLLFEYFSSKVQRAENFLDFPR